MKPPPFDYVAPRTVADAVATLHQSGGAAAVLAGGQSLLQDLRWRRLSPALLVDIAGIDELAGVTVTGDHVRIGARVRHRDLERPGAVPGPLGRLLAAAAAHIAHPPVRSRGTMVGSLAWAHPAAEWGAVAAGLGATVELASVSGRRELPVAGFLTGPGRTARGPDELVTAVLLPVLPDSTRVGFAEHRRTHASFAQVAVATAVGDGAVHVGLAGAGSTALRAPAAEAALRDGVAPGAAAASEDADPVAEPHAGAEYRRRLVEVLVRRTVEAAA